MIVDLPFILNFRTPRGWRVGVHVPATSPAEAANIVANSAYFKPITKEQP